MIYFSNKIEKLFEGLKKELFSGGTNPFTKRIIIVPSPAMKSWLMTAMADDSDLEIATGIHITYLESAIQEIIATHSSTPNQFPKNIIELDLSIKLHVEIKKLLLDYTKMPGVTQKVWEPLYTYILQDTAQPNVLSKKSLKRILSLSTHLARLFKNYGNYGTKMLDLWKSSPSEPKEWQKELWKRCVNEIFPSDFSWKEKNSTVHLFGLSFISAQHHRLLMSLSKSIPVNYYLLSPCQVFWSEILSDRECKRLMQFWETQQVSEAQQMALEEFIYDKNPLLANWGRVGREMALQVENSDCLTEELYAAPQSCLELDNYKELLSHSLDFSTSETPLTLVECVQADLLLMRKPQEEKKIELLDDTSIQLYVSSSPMREVQTLYDVLGNLIHKHAEDIDPVRPEDIIVMAPDIMKYEPFIQAVFSQTESLFDTQIMDLNLCARHPFIQGFTALINLSSSRWEVSSLLKLFENKAFQKRQKLSTDAIQKIKNWIESADIRWGNDPVHREEILKREFEAFSYMDSNSSGTWKKGIDRLLCGLTTLFMDQESHEKAPISPLNHLDLTDSALLGQWIQLMQSLKDDLEPLADGTQLTFKTWSLYLRCLIDSYLLDSNPHEIIEEEMKIFLDFIEGLKKFENEKFCFTTIKFHLEHYLENQRVGYRESHCHAIRFCSMLPMRALPAKIIVLLGMGAEHYPRREILDSLNKLQQSSSKYDYCPSQAEFDRYLFLETLLSTRKYYILSYVGTSEEDKKGQDASLLISELFGYLDHTFTINGQKPSLTAVKKTPARPYEKVLFEDKSKISSLSNLYYKAAKAYYSEEKESLDHCFIPAFTKEKKPDILPSHIDIKDLLQMAKNPIETHLKAKYRMYIESQDQKNKDEETFILGNLEHFSLKRKALKSPLESILKIADKEGKLPIGPFRDFSTSKLQSEVDSIKKNFHDLKIDLERLFEIELSENYETVQRNCKGNFETPPLKILYQGKEIKIVGTLPHISYSGMLSLSGDDRQEVLKIWPQYLVFLCVLKQFTLPCENKLFFGKSKKSKTPFFEDPTPLLEKYLDYYFHSLENISPLIPEWILEIHQGDFDKLKNKMETTLSERNPYFYNNALKWVLRGSQIPDAATILTHWKPLTEEVFGDFFKEWYSR